MSKYRIKHNKRQNTGLLYFTAIKRITEAACNENKLSKKLTSVVVDVFRREPLKSELEIYKGIVSEYLKPSFKDQGSISKFIDGTLMAYKKLDKKQIDFQRNIALRRLSGLVSLNELLKTKVDTNVYKILSSVYVLVNSHQKRSLQETRDFVYISDKLVGILTEAKNRPAIKRDDAPVMNNLVLDFMFKRFNKKYSALSEKQRDILKEYTTYIMDEPSYKDFPLKMIGVIENACKTLERFEHKDSALKKMSDEAIERAKGRIEWNTEKLVTEAMAYCEIEPALKEPK